MYPIGVQQASRTLPKIIRDTVINCEETIIVAEEGSVVMIDEREWEHIKETLKLLQDKDSLKALLEGHKERDKGNSSESISTEEAFHDLQD